MKYFMVFLLVSAIAAFSNPDSTQHAMQIKEGQKRLNMPTDYLFIEQCEVYDFIVFSTTCYLGSAVSIGFLGNVFIQYDELVYCMEDCKKRHTELPGLGFNGLPPIGGR